MIVCAAPCDTGAVTTLISNLGASCLPVRVIAGGDTRQQSVAAGTTAASGEFVMVHDAARPLVDAATVERVCHAAVRHGAAIAAVPAHDTLKRVQTGDGFRTIVETIDRGTVWCAQTPQMFRRTVLLQALHKAGKDGFSGTDCAGLVEHLTDETGTPVQQVHIVEGSEENFKVTYPADLRRAEWLLSQGANG